MSQIDGKTVSISGLKTLRKLLFQDFSHFCVLFKTFPHNISRRSFHHERSCDTEFILKLKFLFQIYFHFQSIGQKQFIMLLNITFTFLGVSYQRLSQLRLNFISPIHIWPNGRQKKSIYHKSVEIIYRQIDKIHPFSLLLLVDGKYPSTGRWIFSILFGL